MNGQVVAIHVYPVKSCRGVSLDSCAVVETGLASDRIWQVVDADGQPVTQRAQPSLARVETHLHRDHIDLVVEDHGSISVEHPSTATMTVSCLLGLPVPAADGGDEVAEWFSDLLNIECRLAGIPIASDHALPAEFGFGTPRLTFADAAQVLVANTASLDWLTGRASEPFGIDRFRPNLVFDLGEPWLEDQCEAFAVGEATVSVAIEWPRCAIPQIDQVSGERHAEPAKVLQAHRWCSEAPAVHQAARPFVEGNALFGVGCGIGPPGSSVRIGDPVTATLGRNPLISMEAGSNA